MSGCLACQWYWSTIAKECAEIFNGKLKLVRKRGRLVFKWFKTIDSDCAIVESRGACVGPMSIREEPYYGV